MKKLNLTKMIIASIVITIIISGVNNSVDMNTSSFLKVKSSSAKTLSELTDEMNVASSKKSYQFEKKKKIVEAVKKVSKKVEIKVERIVATSVSSAAYIQEDLTLELVEYYNPKKFSTLMRAGDKDLSVSGNLEAANGVVEKIDVTLPDGESIFVEFGEMSQNTFKYDIAEMDTQARGVIYKLDANHYMVSLSDGPHEGTRMKFKNTTEMDTDYEQVDSKVVEASITQASANENGFVF